MRAGAQGWAGGGGKRGSRVLESDGPRRRPVLPAAQPQDGGEFVCDAGDDSAFFTVTVTGGQSPRDPPSREGREAGG